METGDAAQWAATVLLFSGLIFTIMKNGRVQKQRDEKVAAEQAKRDIKAAEEQAVREALTEQQFKHINSAIASPEYGLAALKNEMSAIKLNCADVTAGFKERIKTLEKPNRRR